MMTRVLAAFFSLHARLGTIPLVLLVLAGLYGAYVAKMHLGIDLFRDWGLHIYGPRSLMRWLASKMDG
jgi:hypothetical protein